MTPVIPHFTSECLKNLKVDLSDISWPNINEKILIEDQASFVIQVNGKTRGIIKGPVLSTEKEIINMIMQDKNLKKYIDQKEIQRKIFIPKRLLNIIV
jgi:leucyl-tRNA synthetase